MERDVSAGLAKIFGAMVTVVSEQAPSDSALYIEKREAGDVSPELAALDCAELVERAGTEIV